MGTPRMPSSFIPDTFIPDEEDSNLPTSFEVDDEEPSILGSIWNAAATPLSNIPSNFSKRLSQQLDPGRGTTGIRSIASAYLESLGNIGDTLTSPISLALTALTGGTSLAAKAGLSGTARALNIGTKALSAPIAAHGAKSLYEAEDIPTALTAGLETAGGVLGTFAKVPKINRIAGSVVESAENVRQPLRPTAQIHPEETFKEYPPMMPANRADKGILAAAMRMSDNPETVLYPRTEPEGFLKYVETDKAIQNELQRPEMLARQRFERFLEPGSSEIPAAPYSEKLGFEAEPQNVPPGPTGQLYYTVPNRLYPRTAQTVTEAVTPENIKTPPHIRESEIPEIQTLPRSNVGDVPIERTAGPLAPGGKVKITPYETKVDNYVNNNIEPAIPGASAEINPITTQNRSTLGRLADGLLISGERQLQKMGPSGENILALLQQVEYTKRELFNKFAGPYIEATKGLSPEEVTNFADVLDGTAEPISPNVMQAAQVTRQLTDVMGDMAGTTGVRVKTPNGKIVPFQPLKEYWPHRPVNPVSRSSFIDELIARNPKLSRSQAERLARNFQNESEFFNSPQHSRMFGKFEYRKDLNAMTDHMADMADIIARAKVLGPGDIGRRTSVISRMIESSPNPSRAYELVRTHLRGGMDKNDAFYQSVKSINNIATKSQVFTKLGMFPISNLNNQLQTMMFGGAQEFAKAFTQALTGSSELKALAKEYGTVSVGDIPAGILSEAGKRQVPIVGGLVKWADDFSRLVATGAGKGTAQTLFKAAQTGDRLAKRKLSNLLMGEDIVEVLKQNKLNPEQLKTATHRFVELSQQLNSNVKLPPAWVNEPLLHIPLIFKRFSFQGTKAVKDAILQDPKRNIPLFLVMSPLLGELTGDLKSVVYGMVRGAPYPDQMLDSIAFELAGRHKFAGKITGLDSDESDLSWLVNRLSADILQSWGLGLVADMLQGALGGKNAGYTALFGPFVDQAINIITNTASGTQKVLSGDIEGAGTNVKELGREGLRSVPFFGPGLQRRLLPYESQEMGQ